MPLSHLLGFARLSCGCLVARYHGHAVDREVDYVEERGCCCICSDHKLHQPLPYTARTSTKTKHPSAPSSSSVSSSPL